MMQRGARNTALAFFTVYALWQASTLFHLLFVPHAILDSGRVTDVDPETGCPRPGPENGVPVDENCPYLAQLTTAQTLVSQDFQFNPSIDAVPVPVVPSSGRHVAGSIDILHLSPCNSPPDHV